MDHVARAMQQIKEASLQNVEQASQLEHSARALNVLGQQLKELVARYQDGRRI
jgi:methyl-accepting chemotaxis protein